MMQRNLGPLTYLWMIFIVAFAKISLPLYFFVAGYLGEANMPVLIWALFGIFAVPGIVLLLRRPRQVLFVAAAFVVGIFVALTPLFETHGERIHLLLFGVLGVMISRDLRERGPWTALIVVLIACTLVASIDEIVQAYTPRRMGQAKDVLLGVLGGIWGWLMWRAYARHG